MHYKLSECSRAYRPYRCISRTHSTRHFGCACGVRQICACVCLHISVWSISTFCFNAISKLVPDCIVEADAQVKKNPSKCDSNMTAFMRHMTVFVQANFFHTGQIFFFHPVYNHIEINPKKSLPSCTSSSKTHCCYRVSDESYHFNAMLRAGRANDEYSRVREHTEHMFVIGIQTRRKTGPNEYAYRTSAFHRLGFSHFAIEFFFIIEK